MYIPNLFLYVSYTIVYTCIPILYFQDITPKISNFYFKSDFDSFLLWIPVKFPACMFKRFRLNSYKLKF